MNPTIKPVDSRAGSPQAKQLTQREHSPTHHQTKVLLSMTQPTRARPSFSHCQSLPSASSTRRQTEEARRTTTPQPPEKKPQPQDVNQNKKVEKYSQMKEQNPRKTTKWSRDRQPSRKRIQNNDSADDPGSWKQNEEDARNVYQIPRRTKGQR